MGEKEDYLIIGKFGGQMYELGFKDGVRLAHEKLIPSEHETLLFVEELNEGISVVDAVRLYREYLERFVRESKNNASA